MVTIIKNRGSVEVEGIEGIEGIGYLVDTTQHRLGHAPHHITGSSGYLRGW